jgi:hypothetical protein
MTIAAWQARQSHIQSEEHESQEYKVKGYLTDSEWITIDGEGWGRDELGRQYYRFMVAANASSFQTYLPPQTQGRHCVSTEECLTWIASLQQQYYQWCQHTGKKYTPPLIGGFALGYDYAHILTDITAEQLEALLTSGSYDVPPVQITEDFACRITANNLRIYNSDGDEIASIWDTFKFYQAAFLKVMEAYAEPDEWKIIERGKERRTDDNHVMQDELRYCLYECRVHSRAMNALKEGVRKLELPITGWYGPGSLAAAKYRKERTKERFWKSDSEQSNEMAVAALRAFVGGRFETTGHGWLPKMFSHDIRSAYPASMKNLPCLKHGRWVQSTQPEADMLNNLAVGEVTWHCVNPPGGWGPWPMRRSMKFQELPIWPFDGNSWLWSPEFRAGRFLTADYTVHRAFVYKRCCSCTPFPWVPALYDLRKEYEALGREIEAKVVKLILNSLYGKLAQSVGKPPLPTWIWAGLITQSARTQLLDAIRTDPEHCVMVATDAVYSTVPLHLDFGPGLGQWDGPDEYGRCLVIQAGFWKDYDNDKVKTRGIAKKYVEPLWPVFESLWNEICRGSSSLDSMVVVQHPDHIGLQRARQQGIEKLGRWVDDAEQLVRFGTDKRPILIGEPVDGWWKSAPLRRDKIGHTLSFKPGDSSDVTEYFIMEQPDAAEWGYED